MRRIGMAGIVGALVACAGLASCGGERDGARVEPEPGTGSGSGPGSGAGTETETGTETAPSPSTLPHAGAPPADTASTGAATTGTGSPGAVPAPDPGPAPEPAPDPAPEPVLSDEERIAAFRETIRLVVRMPGVRDLQSRARQRGLRFLNLTWEDTARSWGSSGGPNISDLTLEVVDRFGRRPRTRLLPVLRFPNFSDRTADVPADRVRIRVGNEREGELQTLALSDVLAHLREHLSFPDRFRASSDDFTAPRDTHYLVSAQHVFLPIPRTGNVEFAPVLFNYQSSPGEPAVLCLVATREGTSTQIVENREDPTLPDGWGQRLYFNHAGQRTLFTAERRSDVAARVEAGDARPEDATALEEGANMVMIIQVPLRISPRRRMAAGSGSGYGSGAGGFSGLADRGGGGSDVEAAVIGHGLDEGPFDELRRARIRRDPRYPIRITVQFYQATSNGVVDDADLDAARAQIQRVYDDADFVGSLVVGSLDRPTAATP